MTIIKRDAIVPYSTEEMFHLVNNVRDYPDFVPWCKSSEVLSESKDEVRTRLHFERAGLHKSFSTCNRLQAHKMIHIKLLDGPFHQLEGFWRFESVPEGCHISLDLEFEFTNPLVGTLFGPLFNPVAATLVEVFCTRAKQLYQKP